MYCVYVSVIRVAFRQCCFNISVLITVTVRRVAFQEISFCNTSVILDRPLYVLTGINFRCVTRHRCSVEYEMKPFTDSFETEKFSRPERQSLAAKYVFLHARFLRFKIRRNFR
jgi:hypothetical protein